MSMKRLISYLLVLVMMMSLLSVGAAATEDSVTGDGSSGEVGDVLVGESAGGSEEDTGAANEEQTLPEAGEEFPQDPVEPAENEEPVRDPNRMYISEEGIAFVCEFEGYRQFAYPDGGKWYIGYGTLCEKDQYPDGVTQEEAVTIMLKHMESMEDKLNTFLKKYDIKLSQHQYDALMSMTYNVGTGWINPAYRICQYLMNGYENYTQDEMVNAIGSWCHVGKDAIHGLAVRRVREAFLFLTGDYENKGDLSYIYVHYEVGDGEIDHSTVFYPMNHTFDKLPVPICPGKYFMGWYMDNGVMLTGDDIADRRLTVEARWGDRAVDDTGILSTPWDNPYSDLPEEEWYYSYVKNLSRAGKIDGYPDKTFKPNQNMTIGEALKLILLTADYPVQEPSGFHWASGYFDLAVELGFMTAAEGKDLDAPITRHLVARLAALALELPESETETPFADTDDPYVLSLYDVGIVSGNVDATGELVYMGESNIIRSQITAIIWRMYQYVPPVTDEPSDEPAEPTPEELGYIPYRDHKVPILEDVPKATYDRDKFVYEDGVVTYQDKKVKSWMVIDVSNYQGEVDWEKVADSGVEFVMLRIGYRGYLYGTLNEDARFRQNAEGAAKAGLKVGAYFFSTATTVEEAVEEAEYALGIIKDYQIDYPVAYDWEANSQNYRNLGLDGDTLTACAIAFCERVKKAGYDPMVYFNLPTGYLEYDLSQLTDYDFWFAQYPSAEEMYPTMYYHFHMWQYSDSGSIPGIDGCVDMNIAWKKW